MLLTCILNDNGPLTILSSELLPAHWLEDRDDYIKCYCQWYLDLNSLGLKDTAEGFNLFPGKI